MADEQFVKIEYSGDIWTVYDKVGNKYVFGKDLPGQSAYTNRARYPQFSGCINYGDQTWKWMLVEAVDKYGNRLEYYYTKETGYAKNRPSCTESHDYTRAIYPSEIRYVPDQVSTANARYHIFFDLDTTSRTDYDTDWSSSQKLIPVFYQMKRLKTVRVVHDSNGAGVAGGETVARQYELFYDDSVFPSWQWPAGGYSFTLTKIRETELSAQTWPDTNFIYDDMHLLSVDNGFGGEVDFHYPGSEPWYEVSADKDYIEHIVEDQSEAYQGYGPPGRQLHSGSTAYAGCLFSCTINTNPPIGWQI